MLLLALPMGAVANILPAGKDTEDIMVGVTGMFVALKGGELLVTQVTPDTPPCFIWSTAEDTVVPVENSLAFAAALSRNKVPFDLRIYDRGAHGLGLDTPYAWEADLVNWMNRLEIRK